MGNKFALTLAIASLGAAAYGWTQATMQEPVSAPVSDGAAAPKPRIAHDPVQEVDRAPRVFSAKNPLVAPDEIPPPPVAKRWTNVTVTVDERPAPRQATSSPPGQRLSSAAPGDERARVQLVRDIQSELKRVGCYGGSVHGAWGSGTRKAMKIFTERVNAALPVEEPDYILLTLLQNHRGVACGPDCPKGQAADGQGRCMPRAVLAQHKGADKPAEPVEAKDASEKDATVAAARPEPLPGRMSVGAPLAGESERAEIALEKLRREQRQAAVTAAEARRRAELAALQERRAREGGTTSDANAVRIGAPSGLSIPAAAEQQAAIPAPSEPQVVVPQQRNERPVVAKPRSKHPSKGSTRQMLAASLRNAP